MIAFVIVAGGSGRRMHSSIPKQYMMLGDMPILMHTLRHALMILSPEDRVVLVVPRGDQAYVQGLIEQYIDPSLRGDRVYLTEGGDTRTDSVRNGIALVGEADIVAIHDSVRVFFTRSLLSPLIDEAYKGCVAVPVQGATDSIIIATGDCEPYYMDRSQVLQVKTPQVFRSGDLLSAYADYRPEEHGAFTDDASLVRALRPDTKLSVVSIPFFNNKITFPTDIDLALQALKSFDPMG